MESCDESVESSLSLTLSFPLLHRLVQPLLIRLLLAATLAAPAGGEEQVPGALPEALEKTFYCHSHICLLTAGAGKPHRFQPQQTIISKLSTLNFEL